MKIVVVIPTYDEKDNVRPMAKAVLDSIPQEGELLFVDDNSPDGTGEVIDDIAAENPRVHVLHRVKKEGLGRAYISGFKEALRLGAEIIAQMDCDFSHDPASLPNIIDALKSGKADLAVGSRYVKGGATLNWPKKRLFISKLGGFVVRLVTGMPVKDPTGGFRAFKKNVLESIGLDNIKSNGYSFQLETNHRTWMAGFKILEIPIVFAERRSGYSKISAGIAAESLKMVFNLWAAAGFRRSPRVRNA